MKVTSLKLVGSSVALAALMLAGFASAQTAAAPAAPAGLIAKAAFTGTCPAAANINRQADPFCAKTPGKDESAICNGNGTLKNVVIRVVKGAPAGGVPATNSVTMNQSNCSYTPHVTLALPGQKVFIKNSDPVLHNVHTFLGTATSFNMAMPKGRPDIEKVFTPGVQKFKCDVHPWMTGYLVVADNSFACVTGDTGSCTIANLPAGTYTLEAWHEKYGTQTADVTIAAGAPAAASFTFAVK